VNEGVAVWPSGSVVDHINEIVLRRTRLVLGWVTVHGYTPSVCNQPLRPTQPPTLSGTGNDYQPAASGSAPQLGR